MKTSDIYLIVTGGVEQVSDTFNKYAVEFEQYKTQISKKGSSIHLKIEEDQQFVFNRSHLSQLGKLFINDVITELQLNFIVDCILFSVDTFEEDSISKALESLTDPEINGHVTKENIIDLLDG